MLRPGAGIRLEWRRRQPGGGGGRGGGDGGEDATEEAALRLLRQNGRRRLFSRARRPAHVLARARNSGACSFPAATALGKPGAGGLPGPQFPAGSSRPSADPQDQNGPGGCSGTRGSPQVRAILSAQWWQCWGMLSIGHPGGRGNVIKLGGGGRSTSPEPPPFDSMAAPQHLPHRNSSLSSSPHPRVAGTPLVPPRFEVGASPPSPQGGAASPFPSAVAFQLLRASQFPEVRGVTRESANLASSRGSGCARRTYQKTSLPI